MTSMTQAKMSNHLPLLIQMRRLTNQELKAKTKEGKLVRVNKKMKKLLQSTWEEDLLRVIKKEEGNQANKGNLDTDL
jgi:hypothetical protein